MVNSKTTAVRIIPAPGKTVGDEVEFGGLFGRSAHHARQSVFGGSLYRAAADASLRRSRA